MQYFKNTDLARIYPISEKAVRNWVKASKEGSLDLALHETATRTYIANTAQNIAKIEKIVGERKKYSNKLTHKEVFPSDEFYKMYNEEQIFDIINSLEVYREIPLQSKYFGKGAKIWNDFVIQQNREETSIPYAAPHLLSLNKDYFDYLLRSYKRINIVCVGAEIFVTLKSFFVYLSEKKTVGRIILIDVSEAMLENAKKQVDEWFDGSIQLETVKRDMRYERFNDLLLKETLRKDSGQTLNLFLLLGSTIYNFRSPEEVLKTIHHSLGTRDILVHDVGLDKGAGRNFAIKFGTEGTLSPMMKVALDNLNLKDDYYEVEKFYDKKLRQRIIQIRLNVAITLRFNFADGQRIVNLNKDDRITVFRYWQLYTEDILATLSRSGFNLLHASHTPDKGFITTISSVGRR